MEAIPFSVEVHGVVDSAETMARTATKTAAARRTAFMIEFIVGSGFVVLIS